MGNLKEKIKKKIGTKRKALSIALKEVIFASPTEIILFILWITLVIGTTINFMFIKQNIDTSFHYKIEFIFVILRFSFLLITIFYAILILFSKQKKEKIYKLIILFVSLALSFLLHWNFVFIFALSVSLLAMAFYFIQRFLVVRATSKIITFSFEKSKLETKKVKTFLIIIIELVIIYLIKTPIQALLIPDYLKGDAYYAWLGTDMFLSFGGLLTFLLIAWRKQPLYQEVKKTFILSIPILQLYSVYLFLFAFRKELNADQSIPGIIDILLLLFLTSWHLISDISRKLEEKKLILNQRKLILYLFLVYTTTLYTNFITSLFKGLDVFTYWAAVFTGLGTIATFASVTKEIGRKYGAVNVNMFSFIFNTIKYSTETKNKTTIILCPNCNSPIKVSDKFCGHCGFKIEKHNEIKPLKT